LSSYIWPSKNPYCPKDAFFLVFGPVCFVSFSRKELFWRAASWFLADAWRVRFRDV
jgi:hypothetical protein